MRIQLIILVSLFSLGAFSSDDSEVRDLFNRYDRIVTGHEVELIDEVFTVRFISDNGGKEEFIDKIKSEPKVSDKSMKMTFVSWKNAAKSENILAKLKPNGPAKAGQRQVHNDFIVVKENGKMKIDGTVGDAD